MDMKQIKDWLALRFIVAARRLTSWGFVDDHLAEAERVLRLHIKGGY
jgi:hypothetical protein